MTTPTVIKGQRIVRLREVRTPMPPFVMVTWGAFDLHSGSRAKPLLQSATRAGVAEAVTRRGWRYIGHQEP